MTVKSPRMVTGSSLATPREQGGTGFTVEREKLELSTKTDALATQVCSTHRPLGTGVSS